MTTATASVTVTGIPAAVRVEIDRLVVEGPHPIAVSHRDCCAEARAAGQADYCDAGEPLGPIEWVSVGEAMFTVAQLPKVIDALTRVLEASR